MANNSSILAWKIPWKEEPGGLWFVGSQRVGHNWSDWAHMHTIFDTNGICQALCTQFFLCTPWLITTVSIYFHSWWWKYCSAMVTWLETDKVTLYQISVAALTPNCRQSPKLNVQVKGRGSYEIAEGGQGCWLPNLWALIRIRETGPKSKVKAHKVM